MTYDAHDVLFRLRQDPTGGAMSRRELLELLTVERFHYVHTRPPRPRQPDLLEFYTVEDTELQQAARRRVLKEHATDEEVA